MDRDREDREKRERFREIERREQAKDRERQLERERERDRGQERGIYGDRDQSRREGTHRPYNDVNTVNIPELIRRRDKEKGNL